MSFKKIIAASILLFSTQLFAEEAIECRLDRTDFLNTTYKPESESDRYTIIRIEPNSQYWNYHFYVYNYNEKEMGYYYDSMNATTEAVGIFPLPITWKGNDLKVIADANFPGLWYLEKSKKGTQTTQLLDCTTQEF